MGLYFIAKDKTTLEAERWPDVKVVLDFDGVSVEAPDDRMTPFLEACYEELASDWWNRSTKKQKENPELVCYDQEEKKADVSAETDADAGSRSVGKRYELEGGGGGVRGLVRVAPGGGSSLPEGA